MAFLGALTIAASASSRTSVRATLSGKRPKQWGTAAAYVQLRYCAQDASLEEL